MSSIEFMGLLALGIVLCLVVGYLMFQWRAKYIRKEYFLVTSSDDPEDRDFEPYSYEAERYGCVSLLATVVGIFSFIVAAVSFAGLLNQIVATVILPSLDTIVLTFEILYGIVLVFSFLLFVGMAVAGFFRDLFNPPR